MAENNKPMYIATQRVFSNWTALKMIVDHGMGSKEKVQAFCEFIAEIFDINESVHYSDIEIELEEFMDENFNTKLEDGSAKEVAMEISRFHRYFLDKNEALWQSEIDKLPLHPWILHGVPHVVKKIDSSDEDDDDEEEETDPNQKVNEGKTSSKTMEVDEDGFTLVTRRK